MRSSGTTEDGSEFSMAGLAESFLFVPADEVPARVVECWASLWTERVGRYFQMQNASATPMMAVVVQKMIDARSSGVLCSHLHPNFGTHEFFSLESVWGACEALVSGVVDPTSLRLDWISRSIDAREHKKAADQNVSRPQWERLGL